MARIYPLFSSSKGNSVFVGSSTEGVLIDAGVSYKRLCQALCTCGLDINAIKAIFVTHDHSDHISGIKTFTKKHNIPVYARRETIEKLMKSGEINSEGIAVDGEVSVGSMKVFSFPTPHDTAGSCGYRITAPDGKICAVCTDVGRITDEVADGIRGCDAVMLEANYDEEMLRKGEYPFYLKQRISNGNGHLSNVKCGEQIRKLIEGGTMRFILGHLSQDNNTPSVACRTVESYLGGLVRNRDYILEVAPVETTGYCMPF